VGRRRCTTGKAAQSRASQSDGGTGVASNGEPVAKAIFEWIEIFYNRERHHSAPGYHLPVDFEIKLN
jgi:transposase InsO family protein